MSRINGDRREQRLHGFCIKIADVRACSGPQGTHVNHTNRLGNEPANEIFPPAIILSFYECMGSNGKFGEYFARRAAIGAEVFDAVFDLLQKPRDSDFDEFVEIACCDG